KSSLYFLIQSLIISISNIIFILCNFFIIILTIFVISVIDIYVGDKADIANFLQLHFNWSCFFLIFFIGDNNSIKNFQMSRMVTVTVTVTTTSMFSTPMASACSGITFFMNRITMTPLITSSMTSMAA